MKALGEVGLGRLARYGAWQAFAAGLALTPTPPARAALLRLGGARVGRGTVIQPGLRLENLDRGRGLSSLSVGRGCWLGYDVHLDLAGEVVLGDEVTLASRAAVNTHLNVGYADHALQRHVPGGTAPVRVGAGSFVGLGAILLAGARLGPETFVAAGAVVSGEHPGHELLAGVPARAVRRFDAPAGLPAPPPSV